MTEKKSHLSNKAKLFSGGFTMLELTVVLTIASVILASIMPATKGWLMQSTAASNQQRMTAVKQALNNYRMQYGRLPCPSSFLATDPNFGHEVSTACSSYIPDNLNIFGAIGRNGATGSSGTNIVTAPLVYIGALPVRDLGLPDSYVTNLAGYTYSYAVTLSEVTAWNPFAGAIDVVDENNNSVLPFSSETPTPSHGTATYVVVDHGDDGKGAYPKGKNSRKVCTPATGLDVLNCSYAPNPIQFRSAPYSKKAGATWFDDMIVYDGSTSVAKTITPQTCKTVYANGVLGGTSSGYYWAGADLGGGLEPGAAVIFVYAFVDFFYFNAVYSANYTGITPPVDAYCPATYYVTQGGCTMTLNSPTIDGKGAVSNPFGMDTNLGGTVPGLDARYYQNVLPAYSHPTLPLTTGIQGWECNGSTSLNIHTQAYAVCCTGG